MANSSIQFGINAMSTIGAMREDLEGCIRTLHEGGVAYLEAMSDWGAKKETIEFYSKLTGGTSGWDPENTLKRLEVLKKNGMDIQGIFIFDENLEEQAEEMGAYCQQAGISYVVLSFLQYENGIDTVYEKIEMIRRVAAVLRPYGVQILVHNHEHDFLKMTDRDGVEKYIMDIFLEHTTPEELMLEIDTGWVLYAGVNVHDYVAKTVDRIAVLHLKDICKEYQNVPREDSFIACGQGAVDFPSVFAAIPLEHRFRIRYVLDQDASKGDIVEDHIASVRYLTEVSRRVEI